MDKIKIAQELILAAVEIMTGTTAVRNLIREGKIHQLTGTMQVCQLDGMQTMDMALLDLVARGLVAPDEAQSKSVTPNLFAPIGTKTYARSTINR